MLASGAFGPISEAVGSRSDSEQIAQGAWGWLRNALCAPGPPVAPCRWGGHLGLGASISVAKLLAKFRARRFFQFRWECPTLLGCPLRRGLGGGVVFGCVVVVCPNVLRRRGRVEVSIDYAPAGRGFESPPGPPPARDLRSLAALFLRALNPAASLHS